MYKITKSSANRFTIICYLYDEDSHSNKELWSATNITEDGVAQFLNTEKDAQTDFDFGLDLLKSGNGPAFLTDRGSLLPAPVKTPAKEYYDSPPTFSRARALLPAKK